MMVEIIGYIFGGAFLLTVGIWFGYYKSKDRIAELETENNRLMGDLVKALKPKQRPPVEYHGSSHQEKR